MKSFIKYSGGKQRELKYIKEFLPKKFNNLYDPFVGGGSVILGVDADKYFINDKSEKLINMYKYIKFDDTEFLDLNIINNSWMLLDVLKNDNIWNKLFENRSIGVDAIMNIIIETTNGVEILYPILRRRLTKILPSKTLTLEQFKDNILACYKAGYYTLTRELYNNISLNDSTALKASLFVFIRSFCYSGMDRYNSKGEFNVPYGGIGYNKGNLYKRIWFFQSERVKRLMSKTEIYNLDFEEFLIKTKPTKNDLIFLDPPYDTTFSTYDKNIFGEAEHRRLAEYVLKSKSKIMMIIKKTDFMLELYKDKGLDIVSFDKKYQVNIKNRNNQKCKHLLVKNY